MTRLPSVGGDNGTWGEVLNDFLTQSHNGDGTLKANSVGAPQLKPNSVTNAAIADASVSAAKLATAGQADGVATLDSSGSIPEAQLPARLSDASLAATYATAAQGAKADAAIPAAQMGAASGVATLDGSGLLPDAQVPSRLSAAELAATIATTTGYVLVASDTAPADTTRYGVPVLWLDTNEVVAAVPVNPPVPTWNDATSQFTVPSGVVGADYVWTSGGGGVGATLSQGATESTSGSFPRTVVITPVAQQGYVLASGVTTFNHSFPDPNPALTTVITSDTFTGPTGTISGRALDLGLGGAAATWSTSTATTWTTDGSNSLLYSDPTGKASSFTIPLKGSLSATNMRVELDLISATGTAAGNGVGLHADMYASAANGATLFSASFWFGASNQAFQLLTSSNNPIVSQSGATLAPRNTPGHWTFQIYESTITVIDPLGSNRQYELTSAPAAILQGVTVGCSANGTVNCTAKIQNLKISKVAF